MNSAETERSRAAGGAVVSRPDRFDRREGLISEQEDQGVVRA